MKKKLLCVITIAMMMLALVGCGKKPETTIDAFCKALKASDDATMNSLMVDAAETTEEEEEMNEFVDYIKELNQNIQYEIVESVIADDKTNANVTVKFTYSDAKQVMGEVFKEYFSKVLEIAFSSDAEEFTDEKAEEMLQEILADKKATVEVGTAEATVVIPCVKVEKEWKIGTLPDEMLDVASGNIASALENLGDSLGEE